MSETVTNDISHLMCTSGSRFKGENVCEDGGRVDQGDQVDRGTQEGRGDQGGQGAQGGQGDQGEGGGTPTLSLECRDLVVKDLQYNLCVSGVEYDQMTSLVEKVLPSVQ